MASQAVQQGVTSGQSLQPGVRAKQGVQPGSQQGAEQGVEQGAQKSAVAMANKLRMGDKIRETLKRIKPKLQPVHEDALPRTLAHADISAQVNISVTISSVGQWGCFPAEQHTVSIVGCLHPSRIAQLRHQSSVELLYAAVSDSCALITRD